MHIQIFVNSLPVEGTACQTGEELIIHIPDIAKKTGVDWVNVFFRPQLLSDNGSCCLSHDLENYLQRKYIEHKRGAPYHPTTQGKSKHYHRSLKNIMKLQNYYSPEELEREIAHFVDY
jgi:transposase InsO family protein